MYKHILFATDLTVDTKYIFDKVRSLRNLTNAKLSLVHVVEALPGYSYAYLGIEDIEGQLLESAKASLAEIGKVLGVESKNQWVEVGPTKARILMLADDIKADLIVSGSHGRHGLSLLLGSTANAILHGTKCDVLTVRLPEKEK